MYRYNFDYLLSSTLESSVGSSNIQTRKKTKYLDTFDESLSRPKELDSTWYYISDKNAKKRTIQANRFAVSIIEYYITKILCPKIVLCIQC